MGASISVLKGRGVAVSEVALDMGIMGSPEEKKPATRGIQFKQKAEKKILKALRNDDLKTFCQLLRDGVDVNHRFENMSTLLLEACGTPGREKFVKELLEAQADPNIADSSQRTPLHRAAYEKNDKAMELLLNDQRTKVNVWDDQENTALHCATMAFWDNAQASAHERCVQMLLECEDLEVNRPDTFGDSALWNVLQHLDSSGERLLTVMLKFGGDRLNVDVWHAKNGSTIRNFVETKFRKISHLLPECKGIQSEDSLHMQMLLLPNPDIQEFRQILQEKDVDKCYGNPYYCTCLELACRRKDLQGFVEVIIKAGADPNTTSDIYDIPVLHQAMANANYDALKTLINKEQTKLDIISSYKHTALHIAAHKRPCGQEEEEQEMEKCVSLLLRKGRRACSAAMAAPELLRDDAEALRPCIDVDAQDVFGDSALHDAAYFGREHVARPLLRGGADVLVRNVDGRMPLDGVDAGLLHRYLDEQIRGRGQAHSQDYQMIMRFNFLQPKEKTCLYEMDIIDQISRSQRLRELLKHPVIRSFLALKWYLIRWFFYINLAVYTLFIALFTSYMLTTSMKQNCTTSNFSKIEERSDMYPVNEESSVLLSMECDGLKNCSRNITQTDCPSDLDLSTEYVVNFLRIFCIFLLTVLAFIEIMQCITDYKRYFRDWDNLVDIFTIIVCAVALSCDWNASDLQPHIFAVASLFAWTDLILLSGRMPILTIQLEMLKKVSFTFLRFMAWYSLLIFAFALSFYFLFRESSDDEKNFFFNPGMSVIKTIIMMIGELDASNISFSKVSITSHLVFLLFVLFITIILLNLLSGLAVSDTQAIVDEAKIRRLVSLVKLISYFENMLIVVGSCFGQEFYRKMVEPNIRVFRPDIRDKRIEAYKTGKIIFLSLNKKTENRFEKSFELSHSIIVDAMNIVNKKRVTGIDQVKQLLNELKVEIVKLQGNDMESNKDLE